MPQSLYSAAQLVAQHAGIPWADAQRVYQALQFGDAAPSLPKSAGRNIWYAHPNFIARLVIGLAAHGAGRSPVAAVQAFHHATRPETPGTLEEALSHLLRSPHLASDLWKITFAPTDAAFVIEHPTLGGQYVPSDGQARRQFKFDGRMFDTVVTINPLLIQTLADTVEWRADSNPPYRGAESSDSEF